MNEHVVLEHNYYRTEQYYSAAEAWDTLIISKNEDWQFLADRLGNLLNICIKGVP